MNLTRHSGTLHVILFHLMILYVLCIQKGLASGHLDVLGCEPAEEGKQHQLSFRWTKTDSHTEVRLFKNKYWIGSCDTSNCSSYHSRFNILLEKQINQQFVTHLTIRNISRGDATNWKFTYVKKNSDTFQSRPNCSLPTIFRPDNVTCHRQEDDLIGIKINCTTLKVYPAAKCVFIVYINGIKMDSDNNIVYEHTPMESNKLPDGQYFSSSCTYTLAKSLMKLGEYLINVTVSPEIIKSGEEEKYGLTTTIHFHREYKCEGDLYLNSKIPSVLYSPVVLDTKKHINCRIEETNLQVICSTHEICSKVSCIFNVTYSRTDVPTGLETSSYVTSTLEEHCNHSICTLYLKRSDFDSAGVYNIKITISLNTSDISQHIVYENSSFLQFLKVDDSHRRDKTSARFFQIVSISSVAAVLFLMISSALIYIAVFNKRKKQKKIESPKSVKNVKTYENRLSIQSDHNYECIQPEDHYDRCVDLVQDDENRQQDQPMQDIVDTDYITPIETEHMT